MRVVVAQAQEEHQRGPDVGVVRPGRVVQPGLHDSRSDHAQPRGGDVGLNIAVVPGEFGHLGDAR